MANFVVVYVQKWWLRRTFNAHRGGGSNRRLSIYLYICIHKTKQKNAPPFAGRLLPSLEGSSAPSDCVALVRKERRKKAGRGERSRPPMGGMRPRKREKKGLVTTKSCFYFVGVVGNG